MYDILLLLCGLLLLGYANVLYHRRRRSNLEDRSERAGRDPQALM